MQITNVEAIPVEIDIRPLEEDYGVAPYVAGYMTQNTAPRLVIRVETDEGIIGWGETSWGPDPSLAIAAIKNIIEPEVVGRYVWEVEDLLDTFEYPYMHITPYVGGVEMALWDAFGKKLNTPIHQFLGGKRADNLPVAYCLGIMEPDKSAEYAQWACDQGFEVLKTKGGLDVDQDVERLVAMHEAVDGRMKFRLDGNQTMNFEEATTTGARLEKNDVYLQYFEQPLRTDNIGGYKRLRQRLQTAIAVNEDTYHDRNTFELIREDAIDTAVIDMIPAGGLLAAKKNLGLYDDAGISVAHHSGFDLGIKTAAVLQFAAASPTVDLPPDRANYSLTDDVIEDRFTVTDGTMPVPDDPGLGVSVSEEKIEKYRVSEGTGIKYNVSL